jgi:aspartate-semialdehyde dehydrogenase
MIDIFIVVGAGGTVGEQIAAYLKETGEPVVRVSARKLIQQISLNLDRSIDKLLDEAKSENVKTNSLGLIFVHRSREQDPLATLSTELSLTRDFVWALSKRVEKLNVIILGSVTGAFLDAGSSEAYHYAKDLQKSIVRQSCRLKNVAMNILELSWFEKYEKSQQTALYKKNIDKLKRILGKNNLPSVADIANFSKNLIKCRLPPRGQIITYDGGYSLLQK